MQVALKIALNFLFKSVVVEHFCLLLGIPYPVYMLLYP